MIMSTIQLEIVTPERKVYQDDVNMVIVKGELGEIGILPKHAPFVTTLAISAVRIKKEGAEHKVAVSGGFIEVNPDKVIILAESAELPDEIDIDRAMAAKERAERILAQTGKEEFDFNRAQAALRRASTRLDVANSK